MPRKRHYFLLLLLMGLVNGTVTAYLAYHFIQGIQETQDATYQRARDHADQINKKVNQGFLRMRALVDRFAADLTQGVVAPHQVRDRIQKDIRVVPQ